MNENTSQALSALQSKNRSRLFLSMVFFLIALFALVSRWPIAYMLILLACVFHLLSGHLYKRQYTQAYIHALMEYTLKDSVKATAFSKTENADGLLVDKGFTPPVSYVPGAKQHYILHGLLDQSPFAIGEAAFVRKHSTQMMQSVSGTLIVLDGVLPVQEQWVFTSEQSLSGICSDDEYLAYGCTKASLADTALSDSGAAWQYPGKDSVYLPVCAPVLLKAAMHVPLALAARDGSLSLFIESAFFAPRRIDTTKPFEFHTESGFHLPGFTAMQDILKAIRNTRQYSAGQRTV